MDHFANIHNTPFGKPGFREKLHWRKMVKSGSLQIVDSFCAWSDVCGFGAALANAGLDLNVLVKDGLHDVLELMNDHFGKIGQLNYKCRPFTFEDMDRCVILNDGVTKVVDVHAENLEPFSIALWIKNLLVSHWMTLNIINERYKGSLGLKTILSAGQRMQYMKEMTTGEDMLQHGDTISEWGKKYVDTCFTYSPGQLQMNTAFARAYKIDELGSEYGVCPNGFYIDAAFLKALSMRLRDDEFEFSDSVVVIRNGGKPALSMDVVSVRNVTTTLFGTKVLRIGKFTVGLGLESEEVPFDVSDIGVDPFDAGLAQGGTTGPLTGAGDL